MGRARSVVTESLVVHGSSSIAVVARVQAAFKPLVDYVLTEPADDVLQVARSAGRRSRRSEFCTIRTIQEPQRLVVTLSGHLGPAAMNALRAAVHGVGFECFGGSAVESFQPSQQPATSSSFVPPTDWFVIADTQLESDIHPDARLPAGNQLPPPSAVPVAPDSAKDTVLRSSGGPRGAERKAVVRVGNSAEQPLPAILLIGRAPEPRPTDPSEAQTLAVSDAAMSKTHLAFGSNGDHIWVEDRNSSNGTRWKDALGVERSLIPETRLRVELPCQILAGDSVISIGWET